MVEVLVAFVIILLMSTMFARVIFSTVHIQNMSRQAVSAKEAFEEEYYAGSGERTDVQDSLVLDGADGRIRLSGALKVFTGSSGKKRYYFEVAE